MDVLQEKRSTSPPAIVKYYRKMKKCTQKIAEGNERQKYVLQKGVYDEEEYCS